MSTTCLESHYVTLCKPHLWLPISCNSTFFLSSTPEPPSSKAAIGMASLLSLLLYLTPTILSSQRRQSRHLKQYIKSCHFPGKSLPMAFDYTSNPNFIMPAGNSPLIWLLPTSWTSSPGTFILLHHAPVFFFFFNLWKYSWFNNVVPISAVQKSDSVIHVHILFKNIIFHHGLFKDIEYSSLCYIVRLYCNNLYLLTPNPQSIPLPTPPPPMATTGLFSNLLNVIHSRAFDGSLWLSLSYMIPAMDLKEFGRKRVKNRFRFVWDFRGSWFSRWTNANLLLDLLLTFAFSMLQERQMKQLKGFYR